MLLGIRKARDQHQFFFIIEMAECMTVQVGEDLAGQFRRMRAILICIEFCQKLIDHIVFVVYLPNAEIKINAHFMPSESRDSLIQLFRLVADFSAFTYE